MAVRVSKNPLDVRPREKDIDVAVDAAEPESGTVSLRFCEIPKGMVADIKDDIELCIATQRGCINDIDVLGSTLVTDVQRVLDLEGTTNDKQLTIDALKAAHQARIAPIMELQRSERKKLLHLQLRMIAWAVVGHNAADFTDADDKPVPFVTSKEMYDGVEYKVASDDVIRYYRSVGEGFIENVYNAAVEWQRSRIATPQSVWDKHKKDTAQRDAVLRQAFANIIKQAGAEATGEPVVEDDPLALTPHPTQSQNHS